MGYSDKFLPPAEALNQADAMALAQEAFAAAGFGEPASWPAGSAAQAIGRPALPVASHDAGTFYPEHIAIAAIWLACVAVAGYRLI